MKRRTADAQAIAPEASDAISTPVPRKRAKARAKTSVPSEVPADSVATAVPEDVDDDLVDHRAEAGLEADAADCANDDGDDAAVESAADTASPFDGVPAPLRRALEERGFAGLTVVQKAVVDSGAEGRDLQISSQTGSGKTVALGLVIAPGLIASSADGSLQRDRRSVRALVIAPTRELAVQVSGELEWLLAGIDGVSVDCVTGGSSLMQERRRLQRRPTVLVGTPGRLLDHIRTGAVECGDVTQLVLDEADRMLDMGFREELEAILDATPQERSTHLVSATFPAEIQKLAYKYQKDPLAVQGTRLGVANEDIEHVGHLVRLHDRYAAMVNLLLLAGDERALIFVNTRAQASELSSQLAADGFAAAPISGELEQNQRTRTLDAFRNGVTTVLVATDVAARGLDIPDVTLVIHTDAPFDAESYTHRAGRTGRAGRKGRSVLLAPPMRQKKVEYLLQRAKVKLQWREVPGAAMVEKALAKRERRRLREALETSPEPNSNQLMFAAELLEDLDGGETAALVARLVELCRDPRRTAPCEIEPMMPSAGAPRAFRDREPWQNRPDPRAARGRQDGRPDYRQDRGPDFRDGRRENSRHDPRDERGLRERPLRAARDRDGGVDSRPSRGDARAVHFEINWGHRDGATPQRLLAMLCRRGDVTSRAIGAIDIDQRVATFEVVEHVARDFERRVSEPDERDPHLFIRRARARRQSARG